MLSFDNYLACFFANVQLSACFSMVLQLNVVHTHHFDYSSLFTIDYNTKSYSIFSCLPRVTLLYIVCIF